MCFVWVSVPTCTSTEDSQPSGEEAFQVEFAEDSDLVEAMVFCCKPVIYKKEVAAVHLRFLIFV